MRKYDSFASYTFYSRYDQNSWNLAHSYKKMLINTGISIDDIHAVCFATVSRCLKTFKYGQASFFNYWKKLTDYEIKNYVSKNSYESQGKSFVGLSLDAQLEDGSLSFCEILGEEDQGLVNITDKSDLARLVVNPKSHLDKQEQKIMLWTLKGKDKAQIAKHLNISVSGVYAKYSKAIEKLRTAYFKQNIKK